VRAVLALLPVCSRRRHQREVELLLRTVASVAREAAELRAAVEPEAVYAPPGRHLHLVR
jgi:hypothetical protein